MTKEQFIAVINEHVADGEEVAVGGWWTKADTEGTLDVPLTDAEWLRFVLWFEKYQENSHDFDEALYYAIKERKDDE